MIRSRGVWLGAAVLVLLLVAAMMTRGRGLDARAHPSPLETTTMLAARSWMIPRAARDRANPIASTDEVVRHSMEHWADHCATCHGNDGSGKTEIGRALYPPAPDMRDPRTQRLTDGELFYLIEHGVPMTGMPAWGTGQPAGEQASWELVHFVRYLPRLTEKELAEMETMNPKSAGDKERERRIDDFLKGRNRP